MRVGVVITALAMCTYGGVLQAQTAPTTGQSETASHSVTGTSKASAGKGAMPTGAKGVCKDGTYATSGTRSNACKGHKGVKTWFSDGN